MVLYETKNGALCLAVPVVLKDSPVAWSGKTTQTLAKSDGTLMTKTIDNLKTIFSWDGLDPFALQDIDTTEIEFSITGEHEEYQPPVDANGEQPEPVTVFKVQWLNPLIGIGVKMPTPIEDKKSIMARFGAKFKAHSGVAHRPAAASVAAPAVPTQQTFENALPAKPDPAAPATPKPVKPVKPAKPAAPVVDKPKVRISSSEEVYGLLVKQYEGKKTEDEVAQSIFWPTVFSLFGEGTVELTPSQWGQVANDLGV